MVVTLTGLEPVLFALKGRCVNQLHHRAIMNLTTIEQDGDPNGTRTRTLRLERAMC